MQGVAAVRKAAWIVALFVPCVAVACSASNTDEGASAAATSEPRTSTVNDWIRAVCADGTYFDGQGGLEGANGSATCQTEPDRNGNPGVNFGSYTSQSALAHDISIRPSVPYATFANDQGTTWVFFLYGGTETTPTRLEPLADFGFEIFQNDG